MVKLGPERIAPLSVLGNEVARAADGHKRTERNEFAEKGFTNGVATLVTLLVNEGRQAEAERILDRAKAELNSPEFSTAVLSAF